MYELLGTAGEQKERMNYNTVRRETTRGKHGL